MCKAYMQIAEGLKMMAAGYEALAKAGEHTNVEKVAESGRAAAAKEEGKTEPKQEDTEVNISIEDIRAVMRAKNKEGKLEKCQAALREFGAVKLSDIPREKYAELMAKVEVL
uniref:hypothetical protein n=1 Tax=Agathobacter sp. TaxID=2021311 RepID=UPI004056142E